MEWLSPHEWRQLSAQRSEGEVKWLTGVCSLPPPRHPPIPSVTWSVLHLWLAAGCFALAEKCIVYFNADLWRFIHILNLFSPVAPMSLSLLLAFIFFWLVLILYFTKRLGTYCPVGMIAKNLTAVFLPQKKYL